MEFGEWICTRPARNAQELGELINAAIKLGLQWSVNRLKWDFEDTSQTSYEVVVTR